MRARPVPLAPRHGNKRAAHHTEYEPEATVAGSDTASVRAPATPASVAPVVVMPPEPLQVAPLSSVTTSVARNALPVTVRVVPAVSAVTKAGLKLVAAGTAHRLG